MSNACLSTEQPSGGPVIWTSAQLASISGLSHGFTGRLGGVSSGGPLSGLNLSLRVGDVREDVLENQARVARSLGCSASRLLTVKQVHGDHVVRVTRRAGKNIEADGIWTTDRGAPISVLVADCVPIILADRRARVVAAVHAGWRGTCAKIAGVMVGALVEAGFEAEELVAAVGPAIGPECFEIGPEVAEVIRGAYPDAHQCLRPGAGDRWVADLWELNRQCLIESGIPAEQIDVAGLCTYSSEHFYSYRRDGATTGRQAGVVALD
jgi:YfiH family protein